MIAVQHSSAYLRRRFLNWFPLGLSYALLYMGRYNLTVAKNQLGQLMTKEDFGIIFGAGTLTYALAFLINGPLVDRIGGRKGMLIGVLGAAVANLAMGLYLRWTLAQPGGVDNAQLRLVFSVLYSVNMYFQSYGAVAIVKVNASWFHVEERGGFSGIFGTMISSGVFFAFTVNGWILDALKARELSNMQWVVFVAPAALLGLLFVFEFLFLRDRPSEAGHQDFDTGDASTGEGDAPVPALQLFKRIFSNRVIMIVACIEFCTGVLRNGVMHWFPIYSREVWVLPNDHALTDGSWSKLWLVGVMLGVAALSFYMASRAHGKVRGYMMVFGALAFLAPFMQGGWGGLIFVAGVLGANVAGWVSQLFFQNRRAPAAGGLYAILALCCVGMIFALANPGTKVAQASFKPDSKGDLVQAGDKILAVADKEVTQWNEVRRALACVPPLECASSQWDPEECVCSTSAPPAPLGTGEPIPVKVERGGEVITLAVNDPAPKMRAGDLRKLPLRPELPFSPFALGALVFMVSLCVIGTHGLLSGTATMDFGGRKGAGTAVAVIDGFVYLGTGLQSFALGVLTTKDWSYWPLFLLPFAVIGTGLTAFIWNAKPKGKGGH